MKDGETKENNLKFQVSSNLPKVYVKVTWYPLILYHSLDAIAGVSARAFSPGTDDGNTP